MSNETHEAVLGVDQDIAALSEKMGLAPEKIAKLRPDWTRLMREGVIVRLHIGRWRAKTALRYDDIGLHLSEQEAKAMSNVLKLGHKMLAPADVIKEGDAIESGVRTALRDMSYETYWGAFVPATAYEEFRQTVEEAEARYMALRDSITSKAGYRSMVEGVVKEHRAVAASTYRRLKKLNPALLEEIDMDTFVENFVTRILAHIPDRESIRTSYHFEVEMYYVPLPDLLAEETAAAQIHEEQAATESARQQAIREGIVAEQEQAEFGRRIEREKQMAELRATERAADARERLLRDMHEDVVRQARKRKEEMINGFLGDIQRQLTTIIYEACTSALDYITEQGKFHPRKAVQLQNMIDRVQSLNFFGDEEAEKMMARVRQELNTPARQRDIADLQGALRDIAAVTRDTLITLGESPRAAHGSPINNIIASVDLRQARGRLGLDMFDVTLEESDTPGRRGRRVANTGQ